MRRTLLIVGAVFVQAAGLACIFLLITADETSRKSALTSPASSSDRTATDPDETSARRRRRPRRDSGALEWQVIDQLSAHYMLVVKVETERMSDAVRIAQLLTEPLKSSYVEVLVYFYWPADRPGEPPTLSRRVQWTKADGYTETVYEQ